MSAKDKKILDMARNRIKMKRQSSPAVFGMSGADVDDYGVNVGKLKMWSTERQKKLIEQEEIQQEVAISRMRAFVIQIKHIVKIQSWYRGKVQRFIFLTWKNEQNNFIWRYLHGWYLYSKTERMYRVSTPQKCRC
jgi:hypothetical protein